MVLCENVAKTKSELRELDKNLFESLPKEEKTDSYWHSTEKIKDIMSKKDKVCVDIIWFSCNYWLEVEAKQKIMTLTNP